AGEDPKEARVVFSPSRPGATAKGAPLTSRGLSRRQIVLDRRSDSVEATRVGRAALLVNGRVVEKATLRAGDVLVVDGELVLLVAQRDARVLGGGASPGFAFGEPDADGIVGESPATFRLRDELMFIASRNEHV